MRTILAIALALAITMPAVAKVAKKHRSHAIEKCDPPKRWIEVDALADDAGRPSKVVCK